MIWQTASEQERIDWIRKEYKLNPNRSWSATEMKYINTYIHGKKLKPMIHFPSQEEMELMRNR